MLHIEHIQKTYGDTTALNDISLDLQEGIHALLGPNGAGKSTLMKILTRQIGMDAGTITWKGEEITHMKERYFDLLGYAPQQQGLYDEFSGERFLTYMAILKKISKKSIQEEVQRAASLVNMQTLLHKKCKTYSGGMKQRILVAQALLGKPKLLLFDEPTAGLDPKERVALRNIFQSLANDHTLLIATHVVSDIESIADNVIFLKQGQIIAQGNCAHLIQTTAAAHTLEEVYLTCFQEEKDL